MACVHMVMKVWSNTVFLARLLCTIVRLPKTRSGKILRGTMRKIANGKEYTITPTIEDPQVFDYLEPIIKDLVSSR